MKSNSMDLHIVKQNYQDRDSSIKSLILWIYMRSNSMDLHMIGTEMVLHSYHVLVDLRRVNAAHDL